MQHITQITEARIQITSVKQTSQTIALVPTMGNLHEGHLSLVKKAQEKADYVVVSIFINPTQFTEDEDFKNYPRTLTSDLSKLKKLNVDMVFIPNTNEIYPTKNNLSTEIILPELDSIYCGEFRPGHFNAVAKIVIKLFNLIQPDIAIFGEKDYQQLLVIRTLVKNLNFPINILTSPTVREKDGLAMSSRNQHLNKEEREIAPLLYKSINGIAEKLKRGNHNYSQLEQEAALILKKAGIKTEYLNICDAETLTKPKQTNLIIIAAAWLGKTRLIDNIVVHTYHQRSF